MKEPLKSYFSFSRTERIGLIVLTTLLLVLITVHATMHYWVKPEPAPPHDALVGAWENFKTLQIKQLEPSTEEEPTAPATPAETYRKPAKAKFTGAVNINTADSARLVTLKGIGPKLAQKILKRGKEKGPFTHHDQLLEIRKFPEATFEELKKQVIIK